VLITAYTALLWRVLHPLCAANRAERRLGINVHDDVVERVLKAG
jgi:hypothetical protein